MEDSLPPGNVGTDYTGWITACCGQGGPYRRSLVAGRVPGGLRFAGDDLRLVQSTAVVGRPTTVETTSFTVQVRDQLSPGLSLTASPGRITGTPTRAGTFVFTLRVADDGGQSATRQFSITVSA